MICKKCGKQLPEGTSVCDLCGTRVSVVKKLKSKNAGVPILKKKKTRKKLSPMKCLGCMAVLSLMLFLIICAVYPKVQYNIAQRMIEDKWQDCDVGDTVLYGEYEQDGNESNGKEMLKWVILEKEDDSVFIVSKCLIDCIPYHSDETAVTWEDCTLRSWLNSTFMEEAFSKEEQQRIMAVEIKNRDNREYDTEGGNATIDHVFLLSEDDIYDHFFLSDERTAKATDYAIEQGLYVMENYGHGNGSWWLRTPGNDPGRAIYINYSGYCNKAGAHVDSKSRGVRPAMWVKFD